VPVELDAVELLQTMKGVTRRLREELLPLLDQARSKIEPKAVYSIVRVKCLGSDQILLENGYVLRGVVLADMLQTGQDIIPHVITVGSELESMASEEPNLLRAWLFEKVADYALEKSRQYVRVQTTKRLGEVVSVFSPGSGTGELFGLDQQQTLFKVLDPPSNIGVRLTSSCMMVPRKSVSGVFAATREEYVACEYCPRECETRTRPFQGVYQRRTHHYPTSKLLKSENLSSG